MDNWHFLEGTILHSAYNLHARGYARTKRLLPGIGKGWEALCFFFLLLSLAALAAFLIAATPHGH